MVPMKADAYREGYSLESLRELELVPLTTAEARDGFFLHQSLEQLFAIVNEGFGQGQASLEFGDADGEGAEAVLGSGDGFAIDGLKSPLFDPERTPLFRSVKLRNVVLQEVLQLLSLSREKKGRSRKEGRGRISYAQLGINQLGAVYEGLLSYTGFFAQDDLYEVRAAKEVNDEEARTFFVPKGQIDKYKAEELVRDQDGQPRMHRRGSYVFRLAGRDREKSASYYTPEVLTECLTKYTLKERLEGLSADEILELTVCEPAMGSGAFLNEAIDQLADAYLSRKQDERGEVIGAEAYPLEKQRVKYHFAVHNTYGVDLNPLAKELGKTSIWLSVLHPGARAPYLDQRLVTGNSLIGARRDVFKAADLTRKGTKKKPNWLGLVPEPVKWQQRGGNNDGPRLPARPAGTVYHFLVPDEGMVPFDGDKVVKKLEPEATAACKAWRKEICQPFTEGEVATLLRLSDRIDALWQQHLEQRVEVLKNLRQPVPLWGQGTPGRTRWRTVAESEEWARPLYAGSAPGRRLQAIMDYWCALWFWPLAESERLPTRAEWLQEVEELLEGDVDAIAAEVEFIGLVQELGRRERYHHWEVALVEVFGERGGFDVILGNPPWLQVRWDESAVLSDWEPHVSLRRMSAKQATEARDEALEVASALGAYVDEFRSIHGQGSFLGAVSNYSLLLGAKTNLYKCFLVRCWSVLGRDGATGLLHEFGMVDDPHGGRLREELYRRARLVARFKNDLVLFQGVSNQRVFGLTVSGNVAPNIGFISVSNLVHPSTLTSSFSHEGKGETPGIKSNNGEWDTRGHAARLVYVDREQLVIFAELYDEPGVPPERARLPVVHSREVASVLTRFRHVTKRLSDFSGQFRAVAEHLNESRQQTDGTINKVTRTPSDATGWILSGPHFYVATPFNKTPNEKCSHNKDYTVVDHQLMSDDYLPRTNYVLASDVASYRKRTPTWNGRPFIDYFRMVHRQMVAPSGERSLVACIAPPGPGQIGSVFGTAGDSWLVVQLAGLAASLPYDFLIKSTGKGSLRNSGLERLPIPQCWERERAGRTLRLNCLTTHYSTLWAEEFDGAWALSLIHI